MSERQIADRTFTSKATISSGTSLSAAVDLIGTMLVGLIMPSGWDAADITFNVSHDTVTFGDLYDEFGAEKQILVGASRVVLLDPADFAVAQLIKIRSGTSATPVNQTANRTIELIVRAI